MITYRDTSTRVRDEFNRHNVSDQGNALPKLYVSVTSETNATNKSYREWYSRFSPNSNLRVDERCGKTEIADDFYNIPEERSALSNTSQHGFEPVWLFTLGFPWQSRK
jgi:hypothetical protein